MNAPSALLALALSAALSACAHEPPSVRPVAAVDLPRFMGDWYVIAHVPSRPERDAYNAVESYRLDAHGRVRTTFRFRRGSHDAPLKTMQPVGYVRPGTGNAVWGMQFVWPVRAEYVIAYLDPDYRTTIIARSKRDYAWIMARTPRIPEVEYEALLDRLEAMGYRLDGVRRVPQRWPEMRNDRPALPSR
ncbi:lipocalin family protein [Lysobacter solisilvae (ex Woo and Kim 2020)]|uniref:Outer membrane lipoprotein Blc n=1 Tax=Agrilutibacter terrestris TaxID=2865112 RepID=A0A7H0G0E4_9GAMM|nr:lipocalin family protein [Lysobacter terrestris]QNP41760.1 lipocalin family protein [Lysobacter terrestris]